MDNRSPAVNATAVLPPQVRTYMNTNRISVRPQANDYDACLWQEKAAWDCLVRDEGLMKICCPSGGRQPYALPPYIAMPDSGRRFKEIGSVLVGTNPPSITPPNDVMVPVLQFSVPIGYDGVIDTVICGLAPGAGGSTGFVEGSGTIVWRVACSVANNPTVVSQPRFLRNLGNLQFSLGSLAVPIPTPNSSLRVYSGNLITVYADFFASGSGVLDPTATVVCSLSGWFYGR